MYSNQSVQAIVGTGNSNSSAINTSFGMTPEGTIYSLTQSQQQQSNNQYLDAYHKIAANSLGQQASSQNVLANNFHHHQSQQHHPNISLSLDSQNNNSLISPSINNNRLKMSTQNIDSLNNMTPINNSFQQRMTNPSYAVNKASPATVRWLLENYETSEGVSLPRSLLYFHYLKHCSEQKVDAINAASFGKLIRSVFVGLKTRRLGTRGNSKYHYYGIRLNPASPLAQISYDETVNARYNYPASYNNQSFPSTYANGSKRSRSSLSSKYEENNGNNWWQEGSSNNVSSNPSNSNNGSSITVSVNNNNINTNWIPSSSSNNTNFPKSNQDNQSPSINTSANTCYLQYIGNISEGLPDFPDIDLAILADNLKDKTKYDTSIDEVQIFVDMYRDHCETLLETVGGLQFQFVEKCLNEFWNGQSSLSNNGSNEDVSDALVTECPEEDKMISEHIKSCKTDTNNDDDAKLSKFRLAIVVSVPAVLNFIHDADFTLYQKFVSILLPDIMRIIPGGLTQAIRNFAKNLENWLVPHIQNMPPELIKIKLVAVRSLAQALRRYTSLNHLSQAARAVLQNPQQVYQMLADINRVDFNHVIEQAQWVCSCQYDNKSQILNLVESFKSILMKPNVKLEDWCQWLEDVLKKYIFEDLYFDDLNVESRTRLLSRIVDSNNQYTVESNKALPEQSDNLFCYSKSGKSDDEIDSEGSVKILDKDELTSTAWKTNVPDRIVVSCENKEIQNDFGLTDTICIDKDTLATKENSNPTNSNQFIQKEELVMKKCKKFLMSWSFYGSLVIRDLTLRSAASFGSFHLIRLLFDEYLFYSVENKLSSLLDRFQLLILADDMLINTL